MRCPRKGGTNPRLDYGPLRNRFNIANRTVPLLTIRRKEKRETCKKLEKLSKPSRNATPIQSSDTHTIYAT